MKLKFKTQPFQTAAVAAITDVFRGQSPRTDTFTIVNETQLQIDAAPGVPGKPAGFLGWSMGVRNVLELTDEQMIANMNEVQKRHSLPVTAGLSGNQFCVEMETGTGKTYVYTKTIFELHRLYGFTKFIVVVPSIAIREGVYKSFQITAEHFAAQYDNTPVRCFIYDSKKLSQVRLFATSSDIEIMIINIDAFKKSENIINQEQDRLNGETAMSYIQDTRPIVIIDEPQSVDNTPKSKEAIASLSPLAVLRYSATHREKINLLYRLTPVDAYQMGLVKQICVSSNQVENDFNRPYIRLISVSFENGFSAKIEIDKTAKSGKVDRKTITIRQGADLFELSGERDLYSGYTVAGIDCTPGRESIEFDDGQVLPLGKAWGDVDANIIKRAQIKRTIESHLAKELRYTEKGIKVLSLFFIDEVGKYRTDNSQCIMHNSQLEDERGIYARMFEECYAELIMQPRFESVRRFWHGENYELCIMNSELNKVHDGYFSQDKKGNLKDTRGDTADDYDTYSLIMRDKERLLSFECPLRFIFSHSALKEGWDNPNVFQVCTLIEQKSTFTARQKVGRGLRLCVNQDGERIEDKTINILHVMANESFAEFAETLQKEIEQETGIKFGILQLSLFSGLTYTAPVTEEKKVTEEQAKIIAEYVSAVVAQKRETPAAETAPPPAPIAPPALAPVIEKAVAAAQMGATVTAEKVAEFTYTETREVEQTVSYDEAQELMTHLEQKGYVTKSGTIKDTMKEALAAGTLDLPAKFEAARQKFETVIAKANTRLAVQDASKEVRVRLKKQVLISPEFLALWEKIKGRTSYRVAVDEAVLQDRAIDMLAKMERVGAARVVTRTAKVNVENAGVSTSGEYERSQAIDADAHKLPNFLRVIDDECFLSRKSTVDILRKSGRTQDFLHNPQRMTELFVDAVRAIQGNMEIDGIRYQRLDGEEYYLQEIFDSDELVAFLDKNAIPVKNSVYDHVIYDSSTVERPFAVALDDDPDVKMFFKIPDRFKIETPIGTYNPDWGVYMDKDGAERLYFVLETKGKSGLLGLEGLETSQRQKIHCGAAHFRALGDDVVFSDTPVRDWREFKVNV